MAQTDVVFPDMTHTQKLQSFLQNPDAACERTWSTPPSSPTASSSASEDNQIIDFAVDKTAVGPPHDILSLDVTPSTPPFTPPPPHSLLRPVRDPTMLQPQIPKWLRTFQRATSPNFDLSYNALALILVQADPWMAETMAELAQEISWTAAESSPENLQTVITMAGLIHKQFREMRGLHFANCFLWHLEETLLSTFLNVWDMNHHGMAISYQSRPSEEYVVSATRLGILIAELYRRELIEAHLVEVCLETLISNFISVEHADAIQTFFLHTGHTYWFNHRKGSAHIDQFRQAITFVRQKLRGEMSVLNRVRSDQEVDELLNGLCSQCRLWSEQMFEIVSRPDYGSFRSPNIP